MQRFCVFLLALALGSTSVFAQAPTIQWSEAFGGSKGDAAYAIHQTFDGGFILNGASASHDGEVSSHHDTTANYDYWVVKLKNTGGIQWEKCFGGSQDDDGWAVAQTADSNFIAVGGSESVNGDVTCGPIVEWDYWFARIDQWGNLLWNTCYGGSSFNKPYSVIQNSSSDYLAAGVTYSTDGPVTGNHGGGDYWLIKTDTGGTLLWEKCYGGSMLDMAKWVEQCPDGGYIMAGWTNSSNDDVTTNFGLSDFWVVKTDDTGGLVWQKSYGGTNYENAYCIKPTWDGGYIIAGSSNSINGEITGHHGDTTNSDYWVVKIDDTGAIQWQKSLGGSGNDAAYSIATTFDSGYVVAGSSASTDGDVTGNHGGNDYWVVKLDRNGVIQWQMSLGGSLEDDAYGVQQMADSEIVVAGGAASADGEVSGNHGSFDYWVVKLTQCRLTAPTIVRTDSAMTTTLHYSSYQWELNGVAIPGATNAVYIYTDSGTYSVMVTDSIGCTGNSAGLVVPPLAIQNVTSFAEFTIYPNPTTSVVSVSGAGDVHITVYDAVGSILKEAENAHQISLKELPPSLYFIRVTNNKGDINFFDKIVKY